MLILTTTPFDYGMFTPSIIGRYNMAKLFKCSKRNSDPTSSQSGYAWHVLLAVFAGVIAFIAAAALIKSATDDSNTVDSRVGYGIGGGIATATSFFLTLYACFNVPRCMGARKEAEPLLTHDDEHHNFSMV